jgi:cysteine-rich PDZ-binding protein
MVCKKCQKKLAALATPEKWREGARDRATGTTRPIGAAGTGTSSRSTATASKSGAGAAARHKASGNKLLGSAARNRRGARVGATGAATNPYASHCRKCRAQLHQPDARYCQACAFKVGTLGVGRH